MSPQWMETSKIYVRPMAKVLLSEHGVVQGSWLKKVALARYTCFGVQLITYNAALCKAGTEDKECVDLPLRTVLQSSLVLKLNRSCLYLADTSHALSLVPSQTMDLVPFRGIQYVQGGWCRHPNTYLSY